MITLRDYQTEAVKAIENEWESGNLRTLLVLPTGTGKTVVFSRIAENAVNRMERVLILAHRGELLEQAADKLESLSGLKAAVEKAEETSITSMFRVVVGSVQTLMREKRLERFARDHFDVIIVDEAHHILAESYIRVLEYFEDAKVLGVTATPDRGDMQNLGKFFQSKAYEYTLPRAIKDGYLSPIKAQTIPLTLDLSSVAIQGGDFKVSDLGSALDPYLHSIADEMVATGLLDRKTIVFLPLVATSKKFRDILEERGFEALEVNGESEDRAEVLERFDEAGAGSVLCNSMLLTEGYDCPTIDTVIVLRPTKVRSLYAQMVGRGTRLSPGKDHLLILDFLWHTERHELVHPAHLIATSDDVARSITKRLESDPGMALDLEEAEAQAQKDVMKEREEALAKELEEMKRRKRKLVDPLQYEMSIEAEDLSSYVPAFGWEMGEPSDGQKQALENYGINPDAVDSAGKASMLLDKLSKRRENGYATPKQIRFLEQRNFQHVGMWSFQAATKMIGQISSNNWRTPAHINPKTYQPSDMQEVRS